MNEKIILASNSPRRKELLTRENIKFEVVPAEIEEITGKTLPSEVVEDLSLMKAQAVAKNNPGRIVLAADTVVAADDEILGKPVNEEDSFRMLTKLSGRKHQVYTGVTIIFGDGEIVTFSECTDVIMKENSPEKIREYIATGEPVDKAGSYAIQGLGGALIDSINGDYDNVVGLPVKKVADKIRNYQ